MSAQGEGAGRTALITGASAGIGMALARVFAANGFDVVLTARRAERLNALATELRAAHNIDARAFPADLAREDGPAMLIGAIEQAGLTIDALINDAGFGVAGFYRDTAWEAQRDLLQVLVRAPCELTHRLLPGMVVRGYGRILNVASVAGFMPGAAGHTLYGGAKALTIKFSQSLRTEQAQSGVHVSALCPGFTHSEFHDVSGTRSAMRRLPGFMWLTAERVAQEGYRAVMRNDPICVPGMQYKVISALVRLLPRNIAYRIASRRSPMAALHKQHRQV
jgi:short-subunit dehydrogenase